MIPSLASWSRGAASLALLGVAVALCASCGAPQDVPRVRDELGTEPAATGPRPQVRSLVVQVAGMKKSRGGST